MKLSVLKAYKFRIYPDGQQKQFFIETFGCVRFTYNQLLKAKMDELANKEVKLGLTPAKLKKDYPFLKETDSLALANAQRNLERAFRNYFQKRAGFPKMKTKKSHWQSYTTNNQQHTIYFDGDQLKLPKLKSLVPVKRHREIKGTIKSATISAKDGVEFYVSILCLEEIAPLPKQQQNIAIVFDSTRLVHASQHLPVECTYALSTQQKLARAENKLLIKAKAVKRKKMLLNNARNYQKQKGKVAKLYRRHSCQKREYIDQMSYHLVKQYDAIFIEKISEDIISTGNYTISDWHQFVRKIQYKAQWYGKELHFVTLSAIGEHKMTEIMAQMGS
ncbi:RNA-guided endonuclease TnpB family protein [Enterococcus sp. DIV0876]|uniref:RNA-guided endonuclease TnpB family protein n=1 Tax=Enterococcus sp. DIV0876 TaxID=2774633 RepID=UPI003D2FF9A7